MTKRSAAVVGAGIAGLACARVLAEAGLEVRVFDKARGAGGRASTRRETGFSFDPRRPVLHRAQPGVRPARGALAGGGRGGAVERPLRRGAARARARAGGDRARRDPLRRCARDVRPRARPRPRPRPAPLSARRERDPPRRPLAPHRAGPGADLGGDRPRRVRSARGGGAGPAGGASARGRSGAGGGGRSGPPRAVPGADGGLPREAGRALRCGAGDGWAALLGGVRLEQARAQIGRGLDRARQPRVEPGAPRRAAGGVGAAAARGALRGARRRARQARLCAGAPLALRQGRRLVAGRLRLRAFALGGRLRRLGGRRADRGRLALRARLAARLLERS